ncbi:MAG: T9SS type A sorting domain-containing protein [Spirosomataceae bacterium]
MLQLLGGNNGSSWTNAFRDLQSALTSARTCPSCVTQIRVAAGTYKPTSGTERDISFSMVNDVAIYGGFPNDGTGTMANRNWNANPTILSGNIGDEDNNGDNSYSVIRNINNGLTTANSLLDGFTIRDGNANNYPNNLYGGGMYNEAASPGLNNLIFLENRATIGGGMYNQSSSPVLNNVVFSGNLVTGSGGGMFNFQSNPVLNNVTFLGNQASDGGGININLSSPILNNVTFLGNQASRGGGVFLANGAGPILTNVTFSGNQATDGGGICNFESNPVLKNCILWGNGSEVADFRVTNPTYTYCLIQGQNPAGTGNLDGTLSTNNPLFVSQPPIGLGTTGDLRFQACSPAINAGDPATGSATVGNVDLAGNPRFYNNGTVDMGAYEYQSAPPAALTPTVAVSHPATCGGSNGSISLSGLLTNTVYSVSYQKNTSPVAAANFTSNGSGEITLTGLGTGSYTDIVAVSGTCVSNAVTATLNEPAKPTLTLGTIPAICAGATAFTIPYLNPIGTPNKYSVGGTGITAVTDGDLTNPVTVALSAAASGNSISFTLTVKNTATNCVSDNITGMVLINPATVGGNLTGSTAVCAGNNSTLLTLTDHTGTVQKWQSADNADFNNAADIANTSTQFTAANLTQTTYFRAMVKSGVCEAANSTTATVTAAPVTAGGSITGSTTVCTGANSTLLTLTNHIGAVLKWQSADNSNFINAADIANSTNQLTAANLTQTTYYRAVVKSGNCETANSVIAVITVESASAGGSISGSTTACARNNSTLLTLTDYNGSILKWQSADNADFANAAAIANTTNQFTALNLIQTIYYRAVVKNGSCDAVYSATARITITPLPNSALTASQTDVCPNTQVTLDAHCSTPGATVNWNPGAPTVIPDAATTAYVYKASCSANGCTGNESSVEIRTHRILVDMKEIGTGTLPQPILKAVKDNLAPANVIQAPAAPRRWTFLANGCNAFESAVFKLSGPVSFTSVDNSAPYALFDNESSNFYSIDHPNYGTGGSFPNGTYTLTVDLRSQDGAGGPFPKNRVATGALLATRTLQFTVANSAVREGVAEVSEADSEVWAQVSPNPVANTLLLTLNKAKGETVQVHLLDASGRALLQHRFMPKTDQHREVFDLNHITPGMYFLKVNTDRRNTTLKLIKSE